MKRYRLLVLLFVLLLTACSQEPTHRDWFEVGKEAVKEHKWEEANQAFERSLAIRKTGEVTEWHHRLQFYLAAQQSYLEGDREEAEQLLARAKVFEPLQEAVEQFEKEMNQKKAEQVVNEENHTSQEVTEQKEEWLPKTRPLLKKEEMEAFQMLVEAHRQQLEQTATLETYEQIVADWSSRFEAMYALLVHTLPEEEVTVLKEQQKRWMQTYIEGRSEKEDHDRLLYEIEQKRQRVLEWIEVYGS